MNDEHHRIIIKTISSGNRQSDTTHGHGALPSINRWVMLAMMIPVLALMAVLGIFFFTIFVALFSIIAVVIGARIWWLRKTARQAAQQTTAQADRSTVVEDAEIIEETTMTREREQSDSNKDHV